MSSILSTFATTWLIWSGKCNSGEARADGGGVGAGGGGGGGGFEHFASSGMGPCVDQVGFLESFPVRDSVWSSLRIPDLTERAATSACVRPSL